MGIGRSLSYAMSFSRPSFPAGRPRHFRTTVHGTIFAGRDRHLRELNAGDQVVLVPDPPGPEEPGVWVHLPSGDLVGHLPPEIARWLWPWLCQGGAVQACALTVRGEEAPSWRRLVVEVSCDAARNAGSIRTT